MKLKHKNEKYPDTIEHLVHNFVNHGDIRAEFFNRKDFGIERQIEQSTVLQSNLINMLADKGLLNKDEILTLLGKNYNQDDYTEVKEE